MTTKDKPTVRELALLPLRGLAVFPYMVIHLDVGRERSINAIDAAMAGDRELFLTMQKDAQTDEPSIDDLYQVGTVAEIKQLLKLPGGTIRVLVEGLRRAKIVNLNATDPYMKVEVEEYPDEAQQDMESEALTRTLIEQFEQYAKVSKKIPPEALVSVVTLEEPGRLADVIAAHLSLKLTAKQDVLEAVEIKDRLELLCRLLANEMEILELERKINARVRKQMEKTQKEYYLREQLKAIQKELGEKEDRISEAEELREKVEKAKLPKDVREKALKEIDRLEKMPPQAAEATVLRTYLDWILALPWSKQTKDRLDIKVAEQILNDEHYGLQDVKDRILEFLAVRQLANKLKGPILCFVGPPGVGKTSLAKSIANALERKFVRLSLGGVRDEAEIRGHRRTYVGAMPGRIIQSIKQAGTKNPVILLDEIDKLGSDFRGDPSSALLEVLDPEQNSTFSDHYIESPFDLSKVMFITTANVQYSIPRPLLDRMEVIYLPGYTEEEKLQIALRHLLPKQLAEHGLKPEQLEISENAVRKIIREYTKEAGVRNLEREIAAICRKVAKEIVANKFTSTKVSAQNVEKYLGIPRYRYGTAEKRDEVGVAMGLAVTEVGGDTLAIEVTTMKGKGNLTLTGKLGDVMKESAYAGFSYIRSRSSDFGIPDDFYEKYDIHVHVPEGAIPKDGPSAGITIATALTSALTNRPVRKDVAMTGEITLRGRVLAVGGIKEKVLAAHRAGAKTIILPKENEKNLEEIPVNVKRKLKFILAEHLDEVLDVALLKEQKMIIKSALYKQGAVKPDQYPTDLLPEIALVGRSNVGKSSLINALVNRKHLARTSGQPGKTQVLNFFLINDAFYLVDLPGYGFAKVPRSVKIQWGKMIEQYLANRPNLRAVIQLIDIRHPPTKEDIQMFEWLITYQKQIIIACTKADKISRGKWLNHLKVIKQDLQLRPEDLIIPCSAINGAGIEELRNIIAGLIA